MHMTLHPTDAKLVLEQRWGERHPLARGHRLAYFVPESFLMVYAPHNDSDIDVLMEIVKAGVWFVSGKGNIAEQTPDAKITSEEQ